MAWHAAYRDGGHRFPEVKNAKYKNLLDNEFDYGVISTFLSAPLIDVSVRFISDEDRWSYPSSKWTGPPMLNRVMNKERLDYILVSPPHLKLHHGLYHPGPGMIQGFKPARHFSKGKTMGNERINGNVFIFYKIPDVDKILPGGIPAAF